MARPDVEFDDKSFEFGNADKQKTHQYPANHLTGILAICGGWIGAIPRMIKFATDPCATGLAVAG
jgi:hypothetical protein